MKRGQLAHINGDPNDNRPDNLAFLCLYHHDEYDGRFKQSKGITQKELFSYRDDLYDYIKDNLELRQLSDEEDLMLMLEGDSSSYVQKFADSKAESQAAFSRLFGTLDRFDKDLRRDRLNLESIPVSDKKGNKRFFDERGRRMSNYSDEMMETGRAIDSTTRNMLAFFNRAVVLLSDDESVTRLEFVPLNGSIEYLKAVAKKTRSLSGKCWQLFV